MIDVLDDAHEVPTRLEEYADSVHAPTIVISEVLEGLYASGISETEAAHQLSWLSPLAFTSQAARESAHIRCEL